MADEKNRNEQMQNVDEKDRNEQQQPVAEADLEQVSGGGAYGRTGGLSKVVRWDSKGNPTHWHDVHRPDMVFHFVCPHCGRLLHQGAFLRLYCDPCDESWFGATIPDGCKRYEFFDKYKKR